MTTNNSIRNSLFALIVGFGLSAFAQDSAESRSVGTFPKVRGPAAVDERRPHVGILAGFTQADGGRMSSAGDFAVDAGFQPYIPFGAGIELGASNNEVEQVRLMARATYNFGGNIPVLKTSYIGAAAGPVWGSIGDPNKVLLGIAPLAGIDIPVALGDRTDEMTLGVQAKYIMMEGSDPDNLNVNAVARYWF